MVRSRNFDVKPTSDIYKVRLDKICTQLIGFFNNNTCCNTRVFTISHNEKVLPRITFDHKIIYTPIERYKHVS